MSATPLTLEQLQAALGDRCPLCDGYLELSQNGNGPHISCMFDCDPGEIRGAAVALLRKQEPPPSPDALEIIRGHLSSLTIGGGPFPAIQRITDAHGRRITLHLTGGRTLDLGTTAQALNQSHVRAAIGAQLRIVLRRVGQKAGDTANTFDTLIAAIIANAEVIEDEQAIARVDEWLAAFLGDTARTPVIDRDEPQSMLDALSHKSSLHALRDTDGRLYVYGPNLLSHINRAGGDHVTREELGQHLTAAGFERERLEVKHGNKHPRAHMWRSTHPWSDER